MLRPVPELVGNHEEYEVDTILNKRKLRSRDTEYLVKWRGYHVKEVTWNQVQTWEIQRRRCKTLREEPSWEKGLMSVSTPLGGGGSYERNMSETWITRCLSKHCA